MGMADNYYTQPERGYECESCEGTGGGVYGKCDECNGAGFVDRDAECGLCGMYPCHCDSEYDMLMDERMIDGL
jgi:RecJ-like exonuclease